VLGYYVYSYLRSKKSDTGDIDSPYYIGKGINERAFIKHRNVPLPKDKSKIVILSENMTETDALQAEMLLIRQYGRKDLKTGILHNKTDGGEGLTNASDETREKMASKKRGVPRSESAKASVSKGLKGRNVTQITRDKISKKNRNKKRTAQQKKNMSKPKSAQGRANMAKSPETRRKMSGPKPIKYRFIKNTTINESRRIRADDLENWIKKGNWEIGLIKGTLVSTKNIG
jgi:hypothetical protein